MLNWIYAEFEFGDTLQFTIPCKLFELYSATLLTSLKLHLFSISNSKFCVYGKWEGKGKNSKGLFSSQKR